MSFQDSPRLNRTDSRPLVPGGTRDTAALDVEAVRSFCGMPLCWVRSASRFLLASLRAGAEVPPPGRRLDRPTLGPPLASQPGRSLLRPVTTAGTESRDPLAWAAASLDLDVSCLTKEQRTSLTETLRSLSTIEREGDNRLVEPEIAETLLSDGELCATLYLGRAFRQQDPDNFDHNLKSTIKRSFSIFFKFIDDIHVPILSKHKFLQNVSDKLRWGDIYIMNYASLPPSDVAQATIFDLTIILAESVTRTELSRVLNEASDTELLKLLCHGFSPNMAYGGFREGMAAIAAAVRSTIAVTTDRTPQRGQGPIVGADLILTVLNGLESGFYDPEALRKALIAGEKDVQSIINTADETASKRAAAMTEKVLRLANIIEFVLKCVDEPSWASASNRLEKLRRDPPTVREMTDLFQIFGFRAPLERALDRLNANKIAAFDQFVIDHRRGNRQPTFGEICQRFDLDRDLASLRPTIDGLVQIGHQIAAARNADTTAELAVLNRMVMVLPTANKPMESLTYLPTLVRELASTLERLSHRDGTQHAKSDHPILVFDQSSTESVGERSSIFARNSAYIEALARETASNIHHISMEQVVQIGTKLDINSMFDTTGNGKAGYAGGRNIVFLMGPMLHKALKAEGSRIKDMSDLVSQSEPYLKDLLSGVLNGVDDFVVLMGDDDVTLSPGFLDAKIQLAIEHGDGTAKFVTSVKGRDTTKFVQVMSDVVIDEIGYGEEASCPGLDQLNLIARKVMTSTAWDDAYTQHQMAGVLTHPGFCLDLPLTTDENQFDRFGVKKLDYLGTGTSHPGDRYGELDVRVRQFVIYTLQAKQLIDLLDIDHTNTSRSLPWNSHKSPFGNLAEVFEFAADSKTQDSMRSAFLSNLFNTRGKDVPMRTEQAFAELMRRESHTLGERYDLMAFYTDMKDALVSATKDYNISLTFRENLVKSLSLAAPDLARVGSQVEISARDFDFLEGADVDFSLILEQARGLTRDFKDSELAKSMNLIATSALFRFGVLASKLDVIARAGRS